MAAVPWILSFLCAAGWQLSSPSPVFHLAKVVPVGQNVTLHCNLTPSIEITWYHLHTDLLLPLITVRSSELKGGDAASFHTEKKNRVSWTLDRESRRVSLEIVALEEDDSGMYFCAEQDGSRVQFSRGIHLRVNGVGGQFTDDRKGQPCWNLGICVVPALLAFCFAIVIGFYQCSGKPVLNCCDPEQRDASLKVAEEESLHYSSLRHPDKSRPFGRQGSPLAGESVTYSTVAGCRNLIG
ncbi:uncharacterized protein ACNS7B_013622 [Menidia menidia]